MEKAQKNTKLLGRIVSECGNLAEFERLTGWSHRKVSYILNRRQEPTAKEIEKMSTILNVTIPEDMRVLFF